MFGGDLIGDYRLWEEGISINGFMISEQCRLPHSPYICEACIWALKNRRYLNEGFNNAMIISPAVYDGLNGGKKCYARNREGVEQYLADLAEIEPPYLTAIYGGNYRNHWIFKCGVTWDNIGQCTEDQKKNLNKQDALYRMAACLYRCKYL